MFAVEHWSWHCHPTEDVVSDSWPAVRLAELSGEPLERLDWYADAGLLHREAEASDLFAPDSLHRLRLIQHAHRRGISDEDLALATKEQGDLLAVFEELGAGAPV